MEAEDIPEHTRRQLLDAYSWLNLANNDVHIDCKSGYIYNISGRHIGKAGMQQYNFSPVIKMNLNAVTYEISAIVTAFQSEYADEVSLNRVARIANLIK